MREAAAVDLKHPQIPATISEGEVIQHVSVVETPLLPPNSKPLNLSFGTHLISWRRCEWGNFPR